MRAFVLCGLLGLGKYYTVMLYFNVKEVQLNRCLRLLLGASCIIMLGLEIRGG